MDYSKSYTQCHTPTCGYYYHYQSIVDIVMFCKDLQICSSVVTMQLTLIGNF